MFSDLYIRKATELKVDNVKQDPDDNTKLLITTSSFLVKPNLFVEPKWREFSFILEYNLSNPEARKHLSYMGYEEYLTEVSVLNFLKILSKGRKMYKFFAVNALSEKATNTRFLDMESREDLRKIIMFYKMKTCKYENIAHDVSVGKFKLKDQKDDYEENLECSKYYREKLNQLSKTAEPLEGPK